MKIGIALDDWKLPVFRLRLNEAGYTYTDAGALTVGTTLLQVETDDMLKLKGLIQRCQAECARQRK